MLTIGQELLPRKKKLLLSPADKGRKNPIRQPSHDFW
jgi:hypothetical protein